MISHHMLNPDFLRLTRQYFGFDIFEHQLQRPILFKHGFGNKRLTWDIRPVLQCIRFIVSIYLQLNRVLAIRPEFFIDIDVIILETGAGALPPHDLLLHRDLFEHCVSALQLVFVEEPYLAVGRFFFLGNCEGVRNVYN